MHFSFNVKKTNSEEIFILDIFVAYLALIVYLQLGTPVHLYSPI